MKACNHLKDRLGNCSLPLTNGEGKCGGKLSSVTQLGGVCVVVTSSQTVMGVNPLSSHSFYLW